MTRAQPGASRLHEHTFNTALAEELRKTHPRWADKPNRDSLVQAERTGTLENSTKRPDIIITDPYHQPIIMEVELTNEISAEKDAQSRLGEQPINQTNPVHTTIAVIAPQGAAHWRNGHVAAELGDTKTLRYAAFQGTSPTSWERWPEHGWLEGSVQDLSESAIALSITPDDLAQLADKVATKLESLKNTMINETFPGTITSCQQLADQLGQPDIDRGVRCATVVALNATILHHRLIQHGVNNVPQLRDARVSPSGPHCPTEITQQWTQILDINYNSIFEPAVKLLQTYADPKILTNVINEIIKLADAIESARLGSMVDIGGELFPRTVLADRKGTAAFYTTAQIAELLAHLAMPNDLDGNIDWANPDVVSQLRIGDFACGTGTLLRAGYRRLRAHYRRAGGNPDDLHTQLMQRGLVGTDISAIAVHLTATGLANMVPAQPYNDCQTALVALGHGNTTGAIELLENDHITDLLGTTVHLSHGQKQKGNGHSIYAPDAGFDLILMNPPYTRTRGGQATYDVHGLTLATRKQAQSRRRELIKNTPASAQAGDASIFSLLAHRKLKPGARVGLVLPMTAAAAETWYDIRKMWTEHYDDVIIVSTATHHTGQLSADTNMSEIMFTGTRLKDKDKPQNTPIYVTLKRTPKHFAESQQIAKAIHKVREDNMAYGPVLLGAEVIGYFSRMQHSPGGPWLAVGTTNPFLARVAHQLMQGRWCPSSTTETTHSLALPIIPMQQLLQIGPTHHLIGSKHDDTPRGAFAMHPIEPNSPVPPNASVWQTNSQKQTTIRMEPTHYGIPVNTQLARQMQKQTSKYLITRNMRWNAQRLATGITQQAVLGGRAWTTVHHSDKSVLDATTLFTNSIFGLILRWAHSGRQQPGRGVLQIRGLHTLPIPDFSQLTRAQKERVQKTCRKLQKKQLLPAALAAVDPVRKEIDTLMANLLGLPKKYREDLQRLRDYWCQEPSVHGYHRNTCKRLNINTRRSE